MTLYSIQDTTLTGIADALRGWHGETKTVTKSGVKEVSKKVVSKTANATGFNSFNGGYGNNQRLYDVVTVEGASSIKVKMAYQSEGLSWDWVQVASGNLTSMPSSAAKYGGKTLLTTELLFENTDTITFYFQADNSGDNYLGYYAECYGLDENGDYIMVEEMQTWEEEVPNIFKPEEMAAGISDISYFSDEDLTFTGNCEYLFAHDKWKPVIERDAAKLIINPTNSRYMFTNCSYTDLSGVTITSTSTAEQYGSDLFANCYYLEKLPNVSGLVIDANQGAGIFAHCRSLKDETELIRFFSNNSYQCGWPQGNRIFGNCYSLRNISAALTILGQVFLIKSTNTTNYDAYDYSEMFYNCRSLDEVRCIPLLINEGITITSNKFSSAFNGCMRLKEVIFETNDGEPIVLTMSGQTIDLTSGVGYYPYSNNDWQTILIYNSGITEDKRVSDAASYATLHNDPDWFTLKEEYSRYNHDSTVNTINSLPDTSAYLASAGGTNTIKFRGAQGSATDGGAINTLTEEEIAVATAKGWTVAFA